MTPPNTEITPSRHTPEWTVGHKSEYATHNPSIIFDESGNAVADVYGVPLHTTLEDIQREPRNAEALARAYLIAAAPDMLSALKDVPDPHDEGFCDSCSTRRQLPLKKEGERYFFQHDESCWYGKIQAAIFKAEKQP